MAKKYRKSRKGHGHKKLRGVKVRARFGAAGSKFGCYTKRVKTRGNKTRLAAYCSKKLG